MVYLVTQSKRKENQLGYDVKTGEYVCFHHGKEQWRVTGDKSLLDYFTNMRANNGFIAEDEMKEQLKTTFTIWEKYFMDCTRWEEHEILHGNRI